MGAGASFVLGAYLSGCENAQVADPLPTPSAPAQAAEPTLAPSAPAVVVEPTLAPSAPAVVVEPTLAPSAPAVAVEPTLLPATASFTPGVFLRIENNNSVTITVARSEMGQGVRPRSP